MPSRYPNMRLFASIILPYIVMVIVTVTGLPLWLGVLAITKYDLLGLPIGFAVGVAPMVPVFLCAYILWREHDPLNSKLKFLQLRITTAIVLMIAGGMLLWLNCIPERNDCLEVYEYGFPFPGYLQSYEFGVDSFSDGIGLASQIQYSYAGVNIGIGFSILALIGIALELTARTSDSIKRRDAWAMSYWAPYYDFKTFIPIFAKSTARIPVASYKSQHFKKQKRRTIPRPPPVLRFDF